MTRKSITTLAGATALVVGVLAAAGCGGNGGSNAKSPSPLKNPNGQSATVGVANENVGKIPSTRKAARLSVRAGLGHEERVPAPAPSSGRPCGRTASRQSEVERTPRSSRPAPARTASRRSPTTGTRSMFSADQKAGDTNGQGVNASAASVRAVVLGRRNHHVHRLRRVWLLGRSTR
jgi:hypothetical protein